MRICCPIIFHANFVLSFNLIDVESIGSFRIDTVSYKCAFTLLSDLSILYSPRLNLVKKLHLLLYNYNRITFCNYRNNCTSTGIRNCSNLPKSKAESEACTLALATGSIGYSRTPLMLLVSLTAPGWSFRTGIVQIARGNI